jgi:UDP-glucose 4-epimerase
MPSWKKLWYRINIVFWPLGDLWKKVARLPLIDRIIGPILWNERNVDATYIPVGEAVEVGEGCVLPYQLIEDLLGRASTLVALEACVCRTGHGCENYPRDVGCLFLGDASADIDPSLARPISVEEARSHIVRARSEGLLPCIVHGSFDSTLFRIDYRRMLAICFCCNCCCAFRADMRNGPEAYRDRIIRLPGLEVGGAGHCERCGSCVEACAFGAVTLGPEGPVFAEYCKACGRCTDACPHGNIRITLDPGVETREILLSRIRARTDITAAEGPARSITPRA